MAIVESVRKWREILHGRHFILRTDQQAVSYIFNNIIRKNQEWKNIKMENRVITVRL